MSLKVERWRKLGIDHQHARWGEVGPGTDPGLVGSKPGGTVCRTRPGGDLRMGWEDAAGARLRKTGAGSERTAAELRGENDRAKPGASNPSDRPIPGHRRGSHNRLSKTSF